MSLVHHVAADGRVFIVVEGGPLAPGEHRGCYHLTIGLSNCEEPDCGC